MDFTVLTTGKSMYLQLLGPSALRALLLLVLEHCDTVAHTHHSGEYHPPQCITLSHCTDRPTRRLPKIRHLDWRTLVVEIMRVKKKLFEKS